MLRKLNGFSNYPDNIYGKATALPVLQKAGAAFGLLDIDVNNFATGDLYGVFPEDGGDWKEEARNRMAKWEVIEI